MNCRAFWCRMSSCSRPRAEQDRITSRLWAWPPYQHIFSANNFGDFRGMVRDDSEGLRRTQNPRRLSISEQWISRGISRERFPSISGNRNGKAGLSPMLPFLREKFSDLITDPTLVEYRGRR